MSDIRSRFRGASLSSIKDEQEKAEKALPKSDNFSSRPGFHTVVDGKNYRRVAPAHSPKDTPYRAKSTVFLECEVPEVDENGTETGKKTVKRTPIFIATQHSSVLKEDPILLYIQYVYKKANEGVVDRDERRKFLAPITGWRSKDGKWNWGINPSVEYICYAWDEKGILGREQLYSDMLDTMRKISVERADDDTEFIPDIFSDPDEGYPLIITKEKNDKGKYEYSVTCDLPSKRESWDEFFKRTRVTEDQLVELSEKESLTDLYHDVYTLRDFDMAIDGLRRFDKQYKFEIFEDEDFLLKLTEISSLVPVPKLKSDNDETKDVESTELSKESITAVPIPSMKRFLKEYIKENYGDDYELPDLDKKDLEKWYVLAKQGEELPFDTLKSDKKEEPEKKVEDISSVESKIDAELEAQIELLKKRSRRG